MAKAKAEAKASKGKGGTSKETPKVETAKVVKAKDVKVEKTLDNTTASKAKDNVKDIKFWGNGDMWKLICKASSKKEGWMKSTKALQVASGCLIQVTTQQGDNVSEAVTFAPGVKVIEKRDGKGVVIRRTLM
jgi:membrane-bound lytic murein transglycosylase